MPSVLIVTPEAQAEIKAMLERARRNCVPWSLLEKVALKDHFDPLLKLSDRRPDAPELPPSENIILGMWRCAVSFEEQPAGICKHLSIGSDTTDKLPHPLMVEAMCT